MDTRASHEKVSDARHLLQQGQQSDARFDPTDPPKYIRCWGVKKPGQVVRLTLPSDTWCDKTRMTFSCYD